MRILSIIITLIISLCSCGSCFAQIDEIDSLEKILPTLADTVRIDCLHQLSLKYLFKSDKDSAIYYTDLVYNESKKINYIHGIAVALCCQSLIAKHFDDDFVRSERLGKESLEWFDKTANKEGIDTMYSYLVYALFSESKFDEAVFYTQKQLDHAKETADSAMIFDAIGTMCAIYRTSGDYEKSFQFIQQIYDLAQKAHNKIWISGSLYGIAKLYELIEDYTNALVYFRKVIETDDSETIKERIDSDNDIWFKMEFTEAFSHLRQFDSAWHYYNLFKPLKDNKVNLRVYWISTGECYYLQKNYPHALQNFQLGLAEHQRLNDRNEIMRSLLDIGKTYLALNNYPAALKYGREGLNLAIQTKAKQFERDGYDILYLVYDHLHKSDSANFYFREYEKMKDAVLNDQTKAKFEAYNYEQQIALIDKENQINEQQLKIKQQQLQHASLLKKILIACITALFLFAGAILRVIILKRRNEKQQLLHKLEVQRLESDKTKVQLQQQATELEMQAFRAQMNPHFIFNSLNSINMFILENDKLSASEYLSKFSRLVRSILQNSKEAFILMEKELEALRLYLELESLRFENKFEYNISIDDEVDATVIKVPPLIIQPYVENAIWHGLMHKKEKGHLDIGLYQSGETLICKITDDGIGRKKAAELKGKSPTHKSMGTKITEGRIAMIQKSMSNSVEINDLVYADGMAAGTEVLIKIAIQHD